MCVDVCRECLAERVSCKVLGTWRTHVTCAGLDCASALRYRPCKKSRPQKEAGSRGAAAQKEERTRLQCGMRAGSRLVTGAHGPRSARPPVATKPNGATLSMAASSRLVLGALLDPGIPRNVDLRAEVADARGRVKGRGRGEAARKERVPRRRAHRDGHVRAQEARATHSHPLDRRCRIRAIGAATAAAIARETGSIAEPVTCDADFDNDSVVSSSDLAVLLAAWGACP